VHFVGFHYKNISRCTVLWMSNWLWYCFTCVNIYKWPAVHCIVLGHKTHCGQTWLVKTEHLFGISQHNLYIHHDRLRKIKTKHGVYMQSSVKVRPSTVTCCTRVQRHARGDNEARKQHVTWQSEVNTLLRQGSFGDLQVKARDAKNERPFRRKYDEKSHPPASA
jgi:hypothetical protein